MYKLIDRTRAVVLFTLIKKNEKLISPGNDVAFLTLNV